jgi:hypothetical protein
MASAAKPFNRAKPMNRRRATTSAAALNESVRELRRSMRGENARITAGAVTALVITGWLLVLAVVILTVR